MKNEITRKKFLVRLSIALGALAATATSIPIISALIAPLLEKRNAIWRTVGLINDFPVNTTNLVQFINSDPKSYAGVTARSAAWIRRNSEKDFVAFSANCTHLGCPVRWEKNAELFLCPCHGGVYYKDGSVASGPPPKQLNQYRVRIYQKSVQILTAPIPLTNLTA